MQNHHIETTLSQAKGRFFIYNGQKQKLIRYDIKATTIRLVTDVQDINLLYADFEATFQKFEFVEVAPAITTGMEATIISGSAQELKNVLLENIRKVQASKDYIPQAVAIKDNVDSIITLAKTEIEMMKTVRSLGGGGPVTPQPKELT